ncbi:MAG TPA: DUF427 domain-containing protein [Alphaproteobacteria bacterium]|nr:DUF427 domain-containing protein [Alphaproteobacteria bacterium]
MADAAARESGYDDNPDFKIVFEPSPRRVRVMAGGETIADSAAMRLLHEPGHLPVYYFPRGDVRMDLLQQSDHETHCPWKGLARYWSVGSGDHPVENAAWSYEDPYAQIAEIAGYVSFYWSKMDHWYEEDEEVFVHARDPYKRVDVVDSIRQVRVVLGGETVAETTRARFLFETGLPTRYYIPRADVRAELLEPSDTETQCPYKGIAAYHSVRVGGKRFEDIVWYYPDPIAECPRIKDYLCFFNEHVDAIFVDGAEMPCPETHWTKRYPQSLMLDHM